MVPMYKKGGKASKKKSSFMEESKEITFGNKPMKKGYGGMMKYKKGGAVPECGPGKFWDGSKCVDSKTNKLPETSWPDDLVNELIPTYDKKTGKREYAYSEGIFDAEGRARTVDYDEVKKQEREKKKKKTGGLYSAAEKSENISKVKKMNSMQSMDHQTQVKKQTGGPTPPKSQMSPKQTGPMKTPGTPAERKAAGEKAMEKYKKIVEKSNTPAPTKKLYKETGGKSMEPGGGGRFAKMVGKLKGQGKSEESAKAIAASIGRKKYGKSKFQEMAAKGKKGLGGMSDSTSANDAGMEMMENMEAMGPKKPKKKKGSSGTRHTGPNVKRTMKARKNIGKCNRGEICFD